MKKIVLFAVTSVTLFMLGLGTYAASVDAGQVANGVPPSPWEVANGVPPSPWEMANGVPPSPWEFTA